MTDAVPELLIDATWWPLGDGTDASEEVADALLSTLAPTLDGPTAIALRANLAGYVDWSKSLAPGSRQSFALVRDPQAGRVDALMSFRYSALAEDIYDRYLAIASSQESTERVDLVNPSVEERSLPGGRAITVHDFVVYRDSGVAQPTRERVTVALFPSGEPTLIELHIATMDLTLFDDLVEYAVGMISGEAVGVPGFLERTES